MLGGGHNLLLILPFYPVSVFPSFLMVNNDGVLPFVAAGRMIPGNTLKSQSTVISFEMVWLSHIIRNILWRNNLSVHEMLHQIWGSFYDALSLNITLK